jgi:predicted AAA+ superfamily ATPase
MFKRNISDNFLSAIQDTPVVLVNGSRQVGKSTFVKSLLQDTHQYITLDDPTTLMSIKKDPMMFVAGLNNPVIIDEIQRAPELLLPIKKNVDDFRRSGYFVLTGSANVLSLPRVGDSLAGRMEIHTLWPLSRGEIIGVKEDFVQALFSDKFISQQKKHVQNKLSLDELIHWLCQGGYPESISRDVHQRRQKWFAYYMTSILDKDVRELSNIEGLLELPNLMQLIASRCGSLLNVSEVSRTLGIPHTTLKRYLSLLENLYLLVPLPAWSKNITKRLAKAQKIYLNDTGLLLHLMGYDHTQLLNNKGFLGHVLENFIVMELKKQMTWSQQVCRMYYYRTHGGKEVDIVLEAPDARVIAIEVKLANSISPKDFAGVVDLEQELGNNFYRGIVLYFGDTIVPFGSNKHAIPLSYLLKCNSNN